MFESIKTLFHSYQQSILLNAINEFNEAHHDGYKVEYSIYPNGSATIKVNPDMYSTQAVVFYTKGPKGITAYPTNFHFFKAMPCVWSHSVKRWIINAGTHLFDSGDMKLMPLSEYFNMLPGLMEKWYELYHAAHKYDNPRIVLVDGVPEFYLYNMQIRNIFCTLEYDMNKDPEYLEYVRKVIDIEIANKKCSRGNPETVGLTDKTTISVWAPESYKRMKTQIDSEIAQRMERAFEELDRHRAAHQNRVEYEQRLSTFIQDADRHFRKKHT